MLHKKHITTSQSLSQTVNRSTQIPFLSTVSQCPNYNLILICYIRTILHPVSQFVKHSVNQSVKQSNLPKLPSHQLSINILITTSLSYIKQGSQHIDTCQLHQVSQSVKQSFGQAKLPSFQMSINSQISTSSNYLFSLITTQRLAHYTQSVN